MKKKGFTLIEILVVIVILVGLTIGGVLGINNIQDKSKDKKLKDLYTEVKTAADVYLTINEGYAIDLLNGKVPEKCLKLYTLQNEGLLSRDLTNPYTNELLDSDTCVYLYLDNKGIIDAYYELDRSGTTSRIDLIVNEEMNGSTKTTNYYQYGYTRVNFNISYEDNKEIKSVTCSGNAKTSYGKENIVITNINSNQTCTVNIGYIKWNVVVETTGGSASPSNSWVINNNSLNVTLNPSTGYTLNNLTESDYTCEDYKDFGLNNNILSINNINKDIKCTINFKDNYYIVKFTSVVGGSIDPSNTSVKHGSSKTFTITPSTGYTLSGVTTTCGSISGNKLTISNVTSDMSCEVNLELQSFSLSLSKGTGVDKIYYKIDNGDYTTYSSSVSVKYGSTYSYYGVASTGYTMNKCTQSSPCSGTVGTSNIDESITATHNTYTVNVVVSGSTGSVSPSSQSIEAGSSGAFMMYPNTGYAYSSISCTGGATTGVLQGTRLVISNVNSDQTCTITNTKITYTLALNVTNGSSNVSSRTVEYGSSASFTISPSSGYRLSLSSNSCGGTLSGSTYTISNVTGNKSCSIALKSVASLYNTILADNSSRSTRTDFSTTLTNDTTGTLYTSTESISGSTAKTVYYYAGNTTNNWVKFGGFYWRIIRTNADGSVRLLYSGKESEGTAGTAAYIGKSGFNSKYDKSIYVGYMYGTTSSQSNARAYTNNSAIKGAIESWYSSNLSSYSNYISTTAVYCNDRTVGSGTWSASGSLFYYAPFTRVVTNNSPSYNCTNSSDAFSASTSVGNGKLTYPIGLMTVDEIVYAGGHPNGNINSAWYYLNSSSASITGSTNWWLLSPYWWSSYLAVMWFVDDSGDLRNTEVSWALGVRPVISIKSSVYATGGDGTPANPYTLSL